MPTQLAVSTSPWATTPAAASARLMTLFASEPWARTCSHSCYIGNIFNQPSPSGLAVFVNSDGKLGTVMSSTRFKEDIKPMDKVSEAILALQPVTFRYKKDLIRQEQRSLVWSPKMLPK